MLYYTYNLYYKYTYTIVYLTIVTMLTIVTWCINFHVRGHSCKLQVNAVGQSYEKDGTT